MLDSALLVSSQQLTQNARSEQSQRFHVRKVGQGQRGDKQQLRGPGYAYGVVEYAFPGAGWPESTGCPAREGPEVAVSPVKFGRAGVSHAAGDDTGGCGAMVNGVPDGPVSLTGLETVGLDGNANSPTVAVDPYDSQKVFAVWGVDFSSLSPVPRPSAIVEGGFSRDGGTDWFAANVSSPFLSTP